MLCLLHCLSLPKCAILKYTSPPQRRQRHQRQQQRDNIKEDIDKEDIVYEDFWIIKGFLAPLVAFLLIMTSRLVVWFSGGGAGRGWASEDLAVLQEFLIPRLCWLDHQRPQVLIDSYLSWLVSSWRPWLLDSGSGRPLVDQHFDEYLVLWEFPQRWFKWKLNCETRFRIRNACTKFKKFLI